MTFHLDSDNDEGNNLDYKTRILMYNWRRGNVDDWNSYENKLNSINWSESTVDMNLDEKVEYLYNVIEDTVRDMFVLNNDDEKKKRKIPKKIKKLFGKKSKLKNK